MLSRFKDFDFAIMKYRLEILTEIHLLSIMESSFIDLLSGLSSTFFE